MVKISANNCGFFDIGGMIKKFVVLVAIILTLSVVIGVYQGIKAGFVVKNQTEVWSSVRTIATALSTYHAAHKHYPPRLEKLLEDHEEPPYLTEWTLNIPDYSLYYSSTVSGYNLQMSPNEKEGMYFFVDESGDIRANKEGPATVASPIYQ